MGNGMIRALCRVFLLLMSLYGTAISHAQQAVCPYNYTDYAGPPGLGQYSVQDHSHIVVMEYTVSHGLSPYDRGPGEAVPTLAYLASPPYYYDSSDPCIIATHAKMLLNAGIDAIAVDVSNAVRCVFDDGANCSGNFASIKQNVTIIYDYYRDHNVPLRIIPVLGAQDVDAWTANPSRWTGDGNGLSNGLAFFYDLFLSHPNQAVYYQGKPLMLLYVGTPTSHTSQDCIDPTLVNGLCPMHNFLTVAHSEVSSSNYADKFTFRTITGFTDSQNDLVKVTLPSPPLYDYTGLNRLSKTQSNTAGTISSSESFYPIWSWVDRLGTTSNFKPSYSADALDTSFGKPENFTVTPAFQGTSDNCTGMACWYAPDAGLRSTTDLPGPVLQNFFNKAKSLQPRFLFVSQFNEFSHPDQGADAEHSNDVEPTSAWGETYLAAVKNSVTDYKQNLTRLVNLSTRLYVGTGDNVAITGFIIEGQKSKTVRIHAPRLPNSLPFGVLAQPQFDVYSGSAKMHTVAGSDPNIQVVLAPGPYTVILSGANNSDPGVGMLEIYDMDNPEIPLINISTRGPVYSGDKVMIGGFVIQGSAPQTVLIRAVGPSLSNSGLQGVLGNPKLDLYSGQTVIASNDDWQTAANMSEIRATGLAPSDPLESAILTTLQPGAYTAIVQGVYATGGIGMIEVFAR